MKTVKLLLGIAVGLTTSRLPASDAVVSDGGVLPGHAIWLDSLDVNTIEQDSGVPQANQSYEANPLKLHGTTYAHGVGTHANSEMTIQLKGVATRFSAMVGVDDEVGSRGSVGFEIRVDGKKVAESGLMRGGNQPQLLTVDLRGAAKLTLLVNDGGDGKFSPTVHVVVT